MHNYFVLDISISHYFWSNVYILYNDPNLFRTDIYYYAGVIRNISQNTRCLSERRTNINN